MRTVVQTAAETFDWNEGRADIGRVVNRILAVSLPGWADPFWLVGIFEIEQEEPEGRHGVTINVTLPNGSVHLVDRTFVTVDRTGLTSLGPTLVAIGFKATLEFGQEGVHDFRMISEVDSSELALIRVAIDRIM